MPTPITADLRKLLTELRDDLQRAEDPAVILEAVDRLDMLLVQDPPPSAPDSTELDGVDDAELSPTLAPADAQTASRTIRLTVCHLDAVKQVTIEMDVDVHPDEILAVTGGDLDVAYVTLTEEASATIGGDHTVIVRESRPQIISQLPKNHPARRGRPRYTAVHLRLVADENNSHNVFWIADMSTPTCRPTATILERNRRNSIICGSGTTLTTRSTGPDTVVVECNCPASQPAR